MANVKKFGTTKIVTGSTVYCIIRREVDGYRMNDADGAFAAAPADPYVSLTEDSVLKGFYEKSESRTAWEPGWYKIFFYKQAGGAPAPASDTLPDFIDLFVVGDQITTNFPFEYAKVATDAGNGATSFKTDLTSTVDSYCVGSYLKIASGALINEVRRISAYNGTSKVITLSSAFTATPAVGVEFYIVNQ
jgi:hypothetical protein